MSKREDRKRSLGGLIGRAAKKQDRAVEKGLQALKAATSSDIEKLRPKVSDQATYNKVIAEVEQATRRNESVAELMQRVEGLGSSAISVAKEVADLVEDV